MQAVSGTGEKHHSLGYAQTNQESRLQIPQKIIETDKSPEPQPKKEDQPEFIRAEGRACLGVGETFRQAQGCRKVV